MKKDIFRILKAVLAMAAGILLCFAIFDLVDRVWNGVVVDWFSRHYMMHYSEQDADGVWHYVWRPSWGQIKRLVLRLMVFTVVVVTGTIFVITKMVAQKQLHKSAADMAGMIRVYMNSQREAGEVFPKEYALVSAQMSEIRALMQQHEQAVKEEAARKNDLITYLAHDLKTPLTSVIGYLSLLEEAKDMPQQQREKYVHVALDKACRLEKLTNEFFEITRYNLQQVVLEKETVDLSFLLLQLADEFYPLLQKHGNEIDLSVKEKTMVYADPDKMARVFRNILKNAIAYSYPDTRIAVFVEEADGMTRILFENRGKTIPRQKLDGLFEKFYRLEEARSTDTGGAGLGLAIAKDIVTLHDGRIYAKSEKEVTVFTVELPGGNEDA